MCGTVVSFKLCERAGNQTVWLVETKHRSDSAKTSQTALATPLQVNDDAGGKAGRVSRHVSGCRAQGLPNLQEVVKLKYKNKIIKS